MKIIELIEILNSLPNKESEVYIINKENMFTSNIEHSIEDNNDIQLYDVALDPLQNIKDKNRL